MDSDQHSRIPHSRKPHKRRQTPRRRRHGAIVAVAVVAAACLLFALGRAVFSHGSSDTSGSGAEEAADEELLDETTTGEEILDSDGPVQVSATTETGIDYTGYDTFEDSEALAELEADIAALEAEGHTVSIYVHDLDGGDCSLAYEADERVYSASSIKGPYCIFVYQDLVETGDVSHGSVSSLVASTINYSDNDAYEQLRESTANMGWQDWVEASGIDTSECDPYLLSHWYTTISARELGQAWTYGYDYLTSGTSYADELGGLFEDTIYSPIHEVLQPTYQVWSKAGWYNEAGDYASYAMNDAGIVFSDTGPYVIAVCTDTNCDFATVAELVDDLNRCHGELAGGATDSLLTDEALARLS